MIAPSLNTLTRRKFCLQLAALTGLAGCGIHSPARDILTAKPSLKLSLSQWSLHRAHFGTSKDNYQQWQNWLKNSPEKVLQGWLKPLDFPAYAKKELGFHAVDYVNTCFFGEARNDSFLNNLRQACAEHDITSNCLMVDEQGYLGHNDKALRQQAVQNHCKWIDAAAVVGCLSVRVNAHGIGSYQNQQDATAHSLLALAEHAEQYKLDILIENHGGLSSHPIWLIETIYKARHRRLAVMLDYDNFYWSADKIWHSRTAYNRYEGAALLMPQSNCISVKSYAFDALGNETSIDYQRMAELAQINNFTGYHSIEFEGAVGVDVTELQGVRETRNLLQRVW